MANVQPSCLASLLVMFLSARFPQSHDVAFLQVYVVVGIAAVAFTGFLLMLVILRFGGNSKFGIKGRTPDFYFIQNGHVHVG